MTVDGEDVRLTAKEFLLLQYLVQHRGRVLSRDLLLTDVWGYQYTGGTRTVDVHIRRLREKLPVLTDAIETIKQFGYKLVETDRTWRPRQTLHDVPHQVVPHGAADRSGHADGGRDAGVVERAAQRSGTASSARSSTKARLAAETLSHRRAGDAGGARRRSRCARAADRRRASPSSRRRHASSATRSCRPRSCARSRITPIAPRSSRRARGPGRRPALQRHAGHRDAVRRRARAESDGADAGEVRLALPLTDIRDQLAALRRSALVAAAAGLVDRAASWRGSRRSSSAGACVPSPTRRAATRLAISRAPARDYGTDEIGTVARVLDESIRDIGRRAAELATDRARMEAILGGMAEGVLVVNAQGHAAARERAPRGGCCGCRTSREGRHYLEIVRHPDIAAQIGARAARRRRRTASSCRSSTDVIVVGAQRAGQRRARNGRGASCCTTSPICAAPIASAATSSPTSRTSCARR